MSDLICVIDAGTTGTRTMIFDTNGNVISKSYEEYPIMKQPVGISEQDPSIWWKLVRDTCNNAIKNLSPDDIIGISGSFHRQTTTIIDKNNEVLHPALTWMDERAVTDTKVFVEDEGLRRTIPKLLWLRDNKPEAFSRTHKIIFPDTYIYLRLCGAHVTHPTNGIGGIMDNTTWKWDVNLAESYNLPLDLWPELKQSGEIIGELTGEAASQLGLKPNIPVIMGGGDQQCSALGLGVIEKGQAKITTGTGTFADIVVEKPIKPAGDFPIFTFPSVVKERWHLEGVMPGTGTALNWFRDNFSQMQVKDCEQNQTNIYDLLTKEASEVPPGSNGLLFVPLYIFRKGTIHGLGWNHSRAHMIRAIMESAALSANMYLTLIEGVAGTKVTEVKADGGAMNSELWVQIFADVMQKEVIVPEVKDGAAMGAAILGFYGCKRFNDLNTGIQNMVRFADRKIPIKSNSKVYKKLVPIFMPTVFDLFDKKRVTKDL